MVCAGSAITGSGLPEPNGPARSIMATSSAFAAAALTAPSIRGSIGAPRDFDVGAERRLEERPQRRERILAQRHARRHRMAAALDEQALGYGATHRAPDIDAGNGTARAGADAAGFQRDRKSWTAEFLL